MTAESANSLSWQRHGMENHTALDGMKNHNGVVLNDWSAEKT